MYILTRNGSRLMVGTLEQIDRYIARRQGSPRSAFTVVPFAPEGVA